MIIKIHTLIEAISQKDIEFYDLYKTGEFIRKSKKIAKMFLKRI